MSRQMQDASDLIDRVAPTHRPEGRPAGYQSWSKLLFLHWQMSAYELENKIPEALTVDTYNGKAWVGMVLFHMSGVRPWWFPAVPGISSFHETNVRTYVHLDGQDPGVWFFSLDAASAPAVSIARQRWKLPYHYATMEVEKSGNQMKYSAERLEPGVSGVGYSIEAEIGDKISQLDKSIPDGQAVPGTFEHFVVERYFMYATDFKRRLHRGRVHHKPYPLCEAQLLGAKETLLESNDLHSDNDVQHVVFSQGVDVEIFPLQRL